MEDYFAIPRLSNSGLTAFKRELNNEPAFFAKESTLEFGRLFHQCLYEVGSFNQEMIAGFPAADRFRFVRMMMAARDSATVKYYLNHADAVFEKVVLFDLYGVPAKMRADVMIPPRKSGHDAKTTACSTLDDFIDTFDAYGYWRQAEIYKIGGGLKTFIFSGISKAAQHRVFTVDVSKHADKMRAAKKEVRELVQLYKSTKL